MRAARGWRGGRGLRRPGVRLGSVAGERGSVTAEAAVVIPVLVAVTAACLWLLLLVIAQLRCLDAADAGARAAALGQGAARAQAVAAAAAPSGADVVVQARPTGVQVVVTAAVRPPGGLLAQLPAVMVSGRAEGPVPAGGGGR